MAQLKGLLRLLDENEAIFVESLGKDLRKPFQVRYQVFFLSMVLIFPIFVKLGGFFVLNSTSDAAESMLLFNNVIVRDLYRYSVWPTELPEPVRYVLNHSWRSGCPGTYRYLKSAF
jgi:hypothetical protein